MRSRPSTLALIAVAGLAVLALAWLGLTGFAFSDYDGEAAIPFARLVAGDWLGFLRTAPAYGGSLVLRAPFALAADGLGGGEVAVYRAVSVPGLLAAAALGVVLARRSGRYAWLVLGLAAANPVTLRALEIGHPEELIGGALCVGAALAAADRRTLVAGGLLGLAIATKAWAVLAVGPVLLALPPGAPRRYASAIAGAIAALVLIPLALAGLDSETGLLRGAQVSGIFQPWQLWWLLGEPSSTVIGGNGLPKPAGWRAGPEWLAALMHPLIAALVVPATLWWARGRDRRPRGEHLLLLLALLFLARCVLDPWNTGYYSLPFLFSLLAWEVCCRPARPPILALATTAAVWATFEWAPLFLSPDLQSVAYLAWALPLAGGLARSAVLTRSPGASPGRLSDHVEVSAAERTTLRGMGVPEAGGCVPRRTSGSRSTSPGQTIVPNSSTRTASNVARSSLI